jgi:hypothetical protein
VRDAELAFEKPNEPLAADGDGIERRYTRGPYTGVQTFPENQLHQPSDESATNHRETAATA